MRVLQIARKDFMDTVRGRQLYFLGALFGIIGAGAGYVADDGVASILFFTMLFLVPLVGLLFTQHSIAGKRSSHEMVTLLGLPFSRRVVVAGTYLGRVFILLTTLTVLYSAAVLAGITTGTSFDVSPLVGGFIMLTLLGAMFISIALGVSTSTESTTVASVASFLVYLVFVFQLWSQIPTVILYVLNGMEFPQTQPTWAELFVQLSPFAALRNGVAPMFDELAGSILLAGGEVPADPPLFMEQWFGLLVLLAWLVLPVLVGYLRFRRSDL